MLPVPSSRKGLCGRNNTETVAPLQGTMKTPGPVDTRAIATIEVTRPQ